MTIKSIAVVTEPGVTVVAAPYAPAGPILAGTSSTSNNIALGGSVTFEMDQVGLGFMIGTRVRAVAVIDTTKWMEGIVSAWDGTDVTFVSDLINGFGTFASWNITVAGEPGKTGPKGDTGAQGPTGPQGIVSLDSPFFTGDPRAPTPLPGDNDNSIATTQFVTSALVNKQAYDPDLTSLAAANQLAIYWRSAADTWAPVIIGTGLTFTSGTLSAGGMAPLNSPAFTGNPTAPTVVKTDNDTTIATTAFVQSVVVDYAPIISPALAGTPTAPTAAVGTNSTQIATTAFVAAGFQPLDGDLTSIAGATGTGIWLYRKADGDWQPVGIGANLGFDPVTGILSAAGGGAEGGIPEAPNDGILYGRASLAWVRAARFTELAAYAPLASPILTGNPQAPTPTAGDSDTSIATTGFVHGAITDRLATELAVYAPLASPVLTGDPQAPTPAAADNDTSIATTAFVKAQGYALLASPNNFTAINYFNGANLIVGHTAVPSGAAGKFQAHALLVSERPNIGYWAADVNPATIFLDKSRGGAIGTHAVIQSGDWLGQIIARGSDGAAFLNGARVAIIAQGPPWASGVPSRISFWTCSDSGGDGDQERVVIDQAGRLMIGKNASAGLTGLLAGLQVHGLVSESSMRLARWSNDGGNANCFLDKSRGAAIGTMATVQVNDVLGQIVFRGVDASGTPGFINGIYMRVAVSAAPTAGAVPSALQIYDTANNIIAQFNPVSAGSGIFLKGATNGAAAAAGQVGEQKSYYRDYSARSGIPHLQVSSFGSITLEAGEWEISAQGAFHFDSGTGTWPAFVEMGLSTSPSSMAPSNIASVGGPLYAQIPNANSLGYWHLTIPPYLLRLTASTTYYQNFQRSGGTGVACYITNTMQARRVR